MTLRELYNKLTTDIEDIEPGNAKFEALCIIEAVWKQGSRELLLSQGNEPVPDDKAVDCLELLERRLHGEPLQYILGWWEFMGLPFLVGNGVLIPRPETELLVELALSHLQKISQPLVLDLCSGSGCIAVSIAQLCPDAQAWGVELSPTAFGYFEQNVILNQAKDVTPIMGDVYSLDDSITRRLYHAITSNPPYIATNKLGELQREVLHEPVMALDGGSDGLDYYRRIPDIAKGLLVDGGLLALEIGDEQGDDVCKLVRDAGYSQVTVHRDLSGNDRVVTAIRLGSHRHTRH